MLFIKNHTKAKKGLSMLELILVLGIISSAAAIIFVQFGAKNNALNYLRLSQGQISMSKDLENILSTDRDTTGINLANLLDQSKSLPAGFTYNTGNGTITTNISTPLAITSSSVQGPNGIPTAIFTYSNLPSGACVALVSATATQMYDTTINGTRVQLIRSQANNFVNNLSTPNIPQISQLCKANKLTNTVQITYLPEIMWGKYIGRWQNVDITNPSVDSVTLDAYNSHMLLAQKYQAALNTRNSWH